MTYSLKYTPDKVSMTGTLSLSLELELGWGRHDRPGDTKRVSKDREKETETLGWLLELCDRYSVPITFNVVGHLLLTECDGHHPGPYPHEWLQSDPGTDIGTNPRFYAPDMVRSIQTSDADHELASHTYTHVEAGEVEDEVFQHELTVSRNTHRGFGLPEPTTFTPPRHSVPPLSTLAQNGIKAVRINSPTYGNQPPGSPLSRFRWILTRKHPPREPEVENGVVKIYSQPYLSLSATHLPQGRKPEHPVFRSIPVRIRQNLHARSLVTSLKDTVEEKSHLHLWSHLHDISNWKQRYGIKTLIKKAAEYRENDRLETRTMRSTAEKHLDTYPGQAGVETSV
ncbi:MAG: polysaccharide deacetylase family protein [Halobacteria archaeon]